MKSTRIGVLALLGLGAAAPATPAQETVAITNVTVISMRDTIPRPGQTVIIRGGRIAEIGAAARVRVPRGTRQVDGTGRWLIPGLFDLHVHTSKTRASALGLYVAHGITSVRDQGSEHAEVLRWRREIREGKRIGPRMIIAGPYLESLRNIQRMRADPPESRVEPFERARIPIGSPEQARRVVDSLARLELDHLKIRTVQDRATYMAIGAAADANRIRLTGHVVSSSLDAFLAAGQDGVDHQFLLPPDSLPEGRRRAFWRELAARDVGVVPTLVVGPESVLRSPEYFTALLADTVGTVHPLRPYLSKFLELDWREQAAEQTPARRAAYQAVWPQILKQVQEMRAAGVRIMAGSDVAVINIFPGTSLHQELELFTDSIGMSPAEALASATIRPAEWLGVSDSVGTIEPGKVADLVLLDADPLADVSNLGRIAAVVVGGRVFDRPALAGLLQTIRQMPDLRANDWMRR